MVRAWDSRGYGSMETDYWQGLYLGKGCHVELGVPAGTAVDYTSLETAPGNTGTTVDFQLSVHTSATSLCSTLSASADASYAGLFQASAMFSYLNNLSTSSYNTYVVVSCLVRNPTLLAKNPT